MALADDYTSDPEKFGEKRVEQIIKFAGEGKLIDDSKASIEFRNLLRTVDSSLLRKYCNNCIEEKFDDCGLALQDIVNEMAIRLGFEVEHGKYRNCPFDGLWVSPEGRVIVVEVKKVSEFATGLKKVDSARLKLIEQGKADANNSSGLLVVGKGETEFLEAQIRGSRYAWEMRLISVEALTRLLILKEEFDEPGSAIRVRRILSPEEYTKLDPIIELLVGSIRDVEESISLPPLQEISNEVGEKDIDSEKPKKKYISKEINKLAARKVSIHLGITSTKNSRATYVSSDSSVAFTILASSYLERDDRYWYGFRKHHEKFLTEYRDSYAAFACGDETKIILIPHANLVSMMEGMSTTDMPNEKQSYWHVAIREKDGKYTLIRKKSAENIDISEYLI